jgi:hypothetical protein
LATAISGTTPFDEPPCDSLRNATCVFGDAGKPVTRAPLVSQKTARWFAAVKMSIVRATQ